MCGRFALVATGEEVAAHYQLAELPFIAPRYNIAPTQPVAAVRLNSAGARQLLSLIHISEPTRPY